MVPAIFISELYYITAGNSINFSPDWSGSFFALNNGKIHGIIYTSDMSLTSCYSMPPVSAATLYTLQVSSAIQIATSIYVPGSLTFI